MAKPTVLGPLVGCMKGVLSLATWLLQLLFAVTFVGKPRTVEMASPVNWSPEGD